MSNGAASDQSKDAAQQGSWGCPYCDGSGQVIVYDRDFRGAAIIERDGVVRGEIKAARFPAMVAAHCTCPMGRWMRSKTDIDTIRRIPDLGDILAGRSRWLANDPRNIEARPIDPRTARDRLAAQMVAR